MLSTCTAKELFKTIMDIWQNRQCLERPVHTVLLFGFHSEEGSTKTWIAEDDVRRVEGSWYFSGKSRKINPAG